MAFDPNEPRDEKGKWAAGSFGGHSTGPFMAVTHAENVVKADQIARTAATVAKDMGYDPTLINISDESKTFQLGDKTHYYAGMAHLPPPRGPNDTTDVKGTITLYTPHINGEGASLLNSTAYVTSHEIAHQQYQAFLNDAKYETEKMKSDPDYMKQDKWVKFDESNPVHVASKAAGAMTTTDGQIREHGFMKADGTLWPPYDSKYPAYQLHAKTLAMHTEVEYAKNDGVSDYSREWWDARARVTTKEYVKDERTGERGTYQVAEAQNWQPMHETIAEIARLRYSKAQINHIVRKAPDAEGRRLLTTRRGIDPVWNELHKAVETNWKRRNK